MKQRINETHMRNGVTIIDPSNTYIGLEVEIEQDVLIYPGSIIKGSTTIKQDAEIGPFTEITDCTVGEAAVIKQSVLTNSQIGDRVQIGPYAHVRPGTVVGNDVKIGHFVEVKKSTIGDQSKIPHLSYVGDSKIGSEVNIGYGTITVNYDGNKKHETIIEDKAFVGCNTNLVAPVKVGKGSYIAAGSTITKDVPEESLSIARARQTNKEGYASRLKKQN